MLGGLTLAGPAQITGVVALDRLLTLPGVTDVVVSAPQMVYVDGGEGLEPTGLRLGDEAEVRRIAVRLASRAGRRLDDAQPFVDADLVGGIRFHAVLAPVARPGTAMAFRIPARHGFDLDDLIAAGAVSSALAGLLRRIVTARLSFLVIGGTGCGKTTLLSTLLSAADEAERVLIIEDTPELQVRLPHVVGLVTRPANIDGAGVVDTAELVRQSLRMRPDRIVVGEVRGPEVVDLLAALNTGHDGGAGTVHANSPAEAIARLEGLCLAAGLPREAANSQLAAGVQVLIGMQRHNRTRRVTEVGVLHVGADGRTGYEPAVRFPLHRPDGIVAAGWARLRTLLAIPDEAVATTERAEP